MLSADLFSHDESVLFIYSQEERISDCNSDDKKFAAGCQDKMSSCTAVVLLQNF